MLILGIILLVEFLLLSYFIIIEYKKSKSIVTPNECEILVSDILQYNLGNEYIIYNNLFFESNDESVQIDHIVVSPYGIFVIETIGKNKYSFYNPIMQNKSHCKLLAGILFHVCIQARIISIVVFGDQAELKCNIKDNIVVKTRDLVKAISQYHDVVLSPIEMNFVLCNIERNFVHPSVKMMKRHIRRIEKKSNK